MDAPRFTLDGKGQLAPADAEAKNAIAARAGVFVLAPTSPDFFCAIRQHPQGGSAKAPRVVCAGDCSAFQLADLIAFLGQARWSGIVRVHAPQGERQIALKDGEVKGASSDDPADRIGEVMVRLGYVERAALEQTLRDTPPSKVGRALVEKGLIQAHDLYKCLTEQAADIFSAMLLAKEGAFVLIDQELEDKQVHNLNISMQSLLMDSIRKIDEMAHFRKRIPNNKMFVAKKRASDGKLEKEEDLVLGLATGEKTVAELGTAAKLTEFDITRVVYRLLEGGYAQLHDHRTAQMPAAATAAPTPAQGSKKAAQPPATNKDPRGVIRVFNFIFREIRDEVAKQKMEVEFIAAANAALNGQALSSSPVIAGLAFDGAGNLPENKLIEQYEKARASLGSEPLASLKQALSDVMFFLLFQAGELLESRADEDLARRVKELLATLEQ